MTITEFLLARVAEDEVAAREAMHVTGDDLASYQIAEWWEKPEHGRVYAGHWHKVVQAGEALSDPPVFNTAALPHVARHDPARVLAECEAKREAIEAAWCDHLRIEGEWGACKGQAELEADGVAPEVVTAFAAVFRNHPDYRDEWRP